MVRAAGAFYMFPCSLFVLDKALAIVTYGWRGLYPGFLVACIIGSAWSKAFGERPAATRLPLSEHAMIPASPRRLSNER